MISKFIQIAVESADYERDIPAYLYALDDWGQVWSRELGIGYTGRWKKIKDEREDRG